MSYFHVDSMSVCYLGCDLYKSRQNPFSFFTFKVSSDFENLTRLNDMKLMKMKTMPIEITVHLQNKKSNLIINTNIKAILSLCKDRNRDAKFALV